jgi:hypothetical protein
LLPAEFWAVKVSVMVAEGDTVRLPVVGTGPTPLMVTPVALSTLQLRLVELPELIAEGLAVKLRMEGRFGAEAGGVMEGGV